MWMYVLEVLGGNDFADVKVYYVRVCGTILFHAEKTPIP